MRVVLFGSMLTPEVDRLSDVDVAVELATKETDFDRAREQNYVCWFSVKWRAGVLC